MESWILQNAQSGLIPFSHGSRNILKETTLGGMQYIRRRNYNTKKWLMSYVFFHDSSTFYKIWFWDSLVSCLRMVSIKSLLDILFPDS